MEISAKIISIQLQDRLKEEHVYSIHSRFPHGINVEAEGRLVFIGNKENEILPYGIVISPEKLSDLHWLAELETVLWKDSSFVTARGCLKTKQARAFSNTLPVLSALWGDPPTLNFPEFDSLQTGFGESIRSAGGLLGEKKEKLAEAVRTGEKLEMILTQWVGSGPGLTPSGDDYLTGILAADEIYHFTCLQFRDAIKNLLDQGYTTDVAANQLICAAEGAFSGSWIGFMKAYVNADEGEMKKNFYKILSYGHTSGRDMFAGFLTGLEIAKHGVKYGE
ncbi:DUF2877 domain-containing protein [Faecalicatena contorta]|uniref:DUF2877 domain-containing protein n=1 Tax=Faecalicatena contorta TaxID=39482 RepID=A0A315ZVW7_9FIRM|nr:DUF2877 domain-containing protein [Faecalicatena contorta]PWJ48764.1 uncharacterized protein DUF2877 [Faecalicatena contorta]SUQ15187.1 Protein of unknown function [Faecalicatena contorta]